MGMKGKVLAVFAGVIVIAAVAVTAAFGAHKADPGITSSSISIGGTFPLTGVASLYKTIPAAEKAYFDYVNDHGGVNGRKINFTILDDGYNPAQTVPLTQQLVEQTKVFADFGSLGTAPNLSVWSYLNQKKVPQVLIATGDSYWGFSYKKYPWTIGYQPDYPGEAKVYGHYITANMPNAKIGVLYQNDAFGKNYYAGLRTRSSSSHCRRRRSPRSRRCRRSGGRRQRRWSATSRRTGSSCSPPRRPGRTSTASSRRATPCRRRTRPRRISRA
jgi:hypothetical protein